MCEPGSPESHRPRETDLMNGRGKSDSAIVAGKPTNKAGQSAAESVEPSAEAEGNASQQSTRRAQDRGKGAKGLGPQPPSARQRKKERSPPPFPQPSLRPLPVALLPPTR